MSKSFWSQDGQKLELAIFIDWSVYSTNLFQLPPKELGNPIEWRFEDTDVENKTKFVGVWDIRRLQITTRTLKMLEEQLRSIRFISS